MACLVLLFAGFFLRHVRSGQLTASEIGHDRAVVEGFGPAFLDTLPSWVQAREVRAARTATNLEHLTD